jgi:Uncharacterized protein conserved in bacteria
MSGGVPRQRAGSEDARCPCLSGETYANCCGHYHRGEASAPTAERLMRSRYSAFAVGDADYLLRTWHPNTRPQLLELDAGIRWVRLDILETAGGGMLESTGVVEFRAVFRGPPGAGAGSARGALHERSRFVKDDRHWYYVDGDRLV